MKLFHGGVGDLWPNSIIKPNMAHARYLDGCPTCELQKSGRAGHVGLDPETPHDFVYGTSDREYARYYASRANKGWLYEIELSDPVQKSIEDPFPTWRSSSGRIIRVIEKRITLTMTERRELFLRWGGTEFEFAAMVGNAGK